MTLGGFVCNVISFLLAAYYIPNFENPAPSWVYVFFALSMLIYMILDNMDGKQSVRTGSSSPLGELLDHGVDSFTVGVS
jgi:phosphatidylglycerophosphate synthase